MKALDFMVPVLFGKKCFRIANAGTSLPLEHILESNQCPDRLSDASQFAKNDPLPPRPTDSPNLLA